MSCATSRWCWDFIWMPGGRRALVTPAALAAPLDLSTVSALSTFCAFWAFCGSALVAPQESGHVQVEIEVELTRHGRIVERRVLDVLTYGNGLGRRQRHLDGRTAHQVRRHRCTRLH